MDYKDFLKKTNEERLQEIKDFLNTKNEDRLKEITKRAKDGAEKFLNQKQEHDVLTMSIVQLEQIKELLKLHGYECEPYATQWLALLETQK